jgi:hypothetical protein
LVEVRRTVAIDDARLYSSSMVSILLLHGIPVWKTRCNTVGAAQIAEFV